MTTLFSNVPYAALIFSAQYPALAKTQLRTVMPPLPPRKVDQRRLTVSCPD
jgi:hypothetical protein